MTYIRFYLLGFFLLTLLGCVSNVKYGTVEALTGTDQHIRVSDLQSLRRMDRTSVLDPALIVYVQEIRQRLEQAWGVPCNCVVIVDSFGGYEAYTLSSSTIVISSGVMAQAESIDEVAALIAHELGHVYAKDNAKGTMQYAALYTVKLAGIAAGAGEYTIALGEAVDDMAKGLIYRRWNQEQEIAADRFSADLLMRAGFSLDGLKMAIRRLGEYGDSALSKRVVEPVKCLSIQGNSYSVDPLGCVKKLSNPDESVYQSTENRLQNTMEFISSFSPEQRRRRPTGSVESFSSIDYLFQLNRLVSDDKKQLRNSLVRVAAKPLPHTLQGNVAVTNKLAVAYAMIGDSKRAEEYLKLSLQSQGRTAWTFNMLFKEVDRSADSKLVMNAINDSHSEIGYMVQLLPVEFYLAKRYKLTAHEMLAYGRCLSNVVDDLGTYNACSKFDKLAASSRGASW